jgi:hypothetical protein
MGYQYQPKDALTMGQSLKVQDLSVTGLDLGLYTLTTPGSVGPSLGEAEKYAVLAGSTVTNTGSSLVTGDLGVSPGTAITGFPPGVVVGAQHSADPSAAQAQIDLLAAIADLSGRTPTQNLTGQDLGTLTLGPGVYKYNSSAGLTGTLHLDAGGDPHAIFIFQIGSTLTTASSSIVSLDNGALAGNVYWQVGSSATLGTSSIFKGDILASASITVTTSVNVTGRLLANTAAVTLDTNVVLKANSGSLGSLVILIREPISRIYNARIKNDLTNAWIEFNSPNLTIVDSKSLVVDANGDLGGILIAGVTALADNDMVVVKYSSLQSRKGNL